MAQITEEQRSKIMASIHSKNTKPEMMVRRYLFACGFRYRVNSIEYTLNHIYLMDREKISSSNETLVIKPYRLPEAANVAMAAEDIHRD